ncbi:MAG: divalent-cation tolerance protein CutA [Methanobrevibacter sp.]|jgi:periplasmic divalent cation tolerance protein|nr:divalent-cation tolerance protein CutA [Candidatus Methanovirga basalitermitum]
MIVLIYITCSNEEESRTIAENLLKERLCGCSNIIENIKSMYWWENKIEKDNESILILKTIDDKVDEIIKRVKELHSYKNPAIIALTTFKTSDTYLEWIKNEIKQ